MEIWKDVKGYEGIYQVSSLGRVKALQKTRVVNSNRWNCVFTQTFGERILVPLLGSNGRYHFTLHKDGHQKSISRARIVADAFVSNPHGYKEINHIDENAHNDLPQNLEWCSHLYNMRYGTRTSRSRANFIKSSGRRVNQYAKSGKLIKEYECIADAARTSGCAGSNISKCCLGKIHSLGGYIWRYAV